MALPSGKEAATVVDSEMDKGFDPAMPQSELLKADRGTSTHRASEPAALNPAAGEGELKGVIPDPKAAGTWTAQPGARGERLSRSVDVESSRSHESVSVVPGPKNVETETAAIPEQGEPMGRTPEVAEAGPDPGDGRPSFLQAGDAALKNARGPFSGERDVNGKVIGDIAAALGHPREGIREAKGELPLNEAQKTGMAVQPAADAVSATMAKRDRHEGKLLAQTETAETGGRGTGRQAEASAPDLSAGEGEAKFFVPDPGPAAAASPRILAEGVARAVMAKPDGRDEATALAEKGKVDLKDPQWSGRMDFAITDAGLAPNSRDAKPVDGAPLVDQITGQLTADPNKGSGRIRITLSPEHLGTLDMDIIVRESKVQVVLTADRNDVRQALQNHSEQLRNALLDQGLQVSTIDFLLRGNYPGANGESAGSHLWWRESNQGTPRRGRAEDKMSLASSLSSLTQKQDRSAAGISLYV
jgi:hypothetical protein